MSAVLTKISVIQSGDGIGNPTPLTASTYKTKFIYKPNIIEAVPTDTNGAFIRYNDATSATAKEYTVLEAASDL
jgi:hypothetical protein